MDSPRPMKRLAMLTTRRKFASMSTILHSLHPKRECFARATSWSGVKSGIRPMRLSHIRTESSMCIPSTSRIAGAASISRSVASDSLKMGLIGLPFPLDDCCCFAGQDVSNAFGKPFSVMPCVSPKNCERVPVTILLARDPLPATQGEFTIQKEFENPKFLGTFSMQMRTFQLVKEIIFALLLLFVFRLVIPHAKEAFLYLGFVPIRRSNLI